MVIIQEKPIGSPHPTIDPAWAEAQRALAWKAIDMDVKPRQLARNLENLATAGDPMALMFMRRLYKYGVTVGLQNDIDSAVSNVCVFALPEIDRKTRKFKWRFGSDVYPQGWINHPAFFQCASDAFYFVLMRLLDAGIEKVERCGAPAPLDHAYQKSQRKCKNYYFVRSNKRWCSARCGVRVSTRASDG